MFNQDQTPLSQLPPGLISPSLMLQLKSCWIETVEELVSVAGVLHNSDKEPKPEILADMDVVIGVLCGVMPKEAILIWMEPQPQESCPLGNDCPPDLKKMYECSGSVRYTNQIVSINPPPLLTACDLSDQLFPVRDQGTRGVCVACTIVSLLEYITQSQEPMSVDFIYTCCKMLDGYHQIEGTDLRTAMGAISRFGICTESMYKASENNLISKNDLMAEAQKNRVENIRQVLPAVIEDYKMKLTGAENSLPMPVAVSLMVFASAVHSPAAALSGKWTLPLPGETVSKEEHAMLVVGYQDDASVPGGGYFIVRNSWSDQWATLSPIGRPGYAMIPYEYMQRFCTDAFTGPKIPYAANSNNMVYSPINSLEGNTTIYQTENNNSKTNNTIYELADPYNVPTSKTSELPRDEFSEKYVYILPKDGREFTGNSSGLGKGVKAGTPVIARPDRRDLYKIDSPNNRSAFMENDCSWDPRQRVINLFPEPISNSWRQRSDFITSSGLKFHNAVRENLKSMTGAPSPFEEGKGRLFFSPSKIGNVDDFADLSDALIFEITTGIPKDLEMTESWAELYKRCNYFKFIRITSTSKKIFYVALVYVHPVHFQSGKEPKLMPVTQEVVEKITSLFKRWLVKHNYQSERNFISLATCSELDDSIRTSFEIPTAFTKITENAIWKTRLPELADSDKVNGLALRKFTGLLTPETLSDKLNKVENEILKLYQEFYQGNILGKTIAAKTEYTIEETEDLFQKLAASGKYDVYKVKDLLAIKKRK